MILIVLEQFQHSYVEETKNNFNKNTYYCVFHVFRHDIIVIMDYELIIIGGGPAGSAAAVYAARKQIKTLLIAKEFGGQSSVSDEIYNWIGTKAISGTKLALSLKEHVSEYAGEGKPLFIKEGLKAEKISQNEDSTFSVLLSNSECLKSRSILVVTGSSHRKLDVPGSKELDHKGVMYCATCDAPLFGGMNVAIVGGGNAAFEGVLQSAQHSSHVTLIHRSDNFRADPITIEKVIKLANVTVVTNAEITEVYGHNFLDGVKFKLKDRGEIVDLKVSGLFVEIGQIPNTTLVRGLVEIDEFNKIKIDARTQRTSTEGIWSAGDCTDGLYHQNNIAAGDAIKAIENIFIWLKTGK